MHTAAAVTCDIVPTSCVVLDKDGSGKVLDCAAIFCAGASVTDDSQLRPAIAESRDRFQRTAHTVSDCLLAVKGLSQQANSARSFREKCSNLLGAAIAASLALQEVNSMSLHITSAAAPMVVTGSRLSDICNYATRWDSAAQQACLCARVVRGPGNVYNSRFAMPHTADMSQLDVNSQCDWSLDQSQH